MDLMLPHEIEIKDLLESGWAPASIRLHLKEVYNEDVSIDQIVRFAESHEITGPYASLRRRMNWRTSFPNIPQVLADIFGVNMQELEALDSKMSLIEDHDSEEYLELQKKYLRMTDKLWRMGFELQGVSKPKDRQPPSRNAPKLGDILDDTD